MFRNLSDKDVLWNTLLLGLFYILFLSTTNKDMKMRLVIRCTNTSVVTDTSKLASAFEPSHRKHVFMQGVKVYDATSVLDSGAKLGGSNQAEIK